MSSLSKEFIVEEYVKNKRSFSSIAKQLGTYPKGCYSDGNKTQR